MRYDAVQAFRRRVRSTVPHFELTGRTPGPWRAVQEARRHPAGHRARGGQDGGRWRWSRSPRGSKTPSRCSPAAAGRCVQAADDEGDARVEPRALERARTEVVRTALGVFRAGGRWRRRRQCVPARASSRTRSSTFSARSWTSRWVARTSHRRCACATGCWRSSASTRGRSWRRAGKPARCGAPRRLLPRPGRRG